MSTWLNVRMVVQIRPNSHRAPANVSLLHAIHMRRGYGGVEQHAMLLCFSHCMVTTLWYVG